MVERYRFIKPSGLWKGIKFEEAEGGQAPGKLELVKISLEDALKFCEDNNFNVLEEIPNFEKNFKNAQDKAKKGWTKRKDMPVIDSKDVKILQSRLKKGNLDIEKPFAKETNPKNPFPQGLSGLNAQDFIKRGLKDGSKTDDIIDVRITKIEVSKLIPIQKQIYYDKSMKEIIKFGLKASIDFISNKSFFIASSNDYIIDGHHRFLSSMLIDPTMKVNVLQIDLPIKKLLPLSLAYGDAIGNKRNA